MKKILILFFTFLINLSSVNAETIEVAFKSCVDGDTAKFIYNNKVIKARFLAIDTPETVKPNTKVQPYGKEASDYTCNRLKEASKIVLEYDDNSTKQDKYERELVWVFVDDSLLQQELIEKGYAKVAYLYGDYKYTNILKNIEKKAKKEKKGIWSDTKSSKSINMYYYLLIPIVSIILIVFLFNKKFRNKCLQKGKQKVKRNLKKSLNRIKKYHVY